MVADSHLLSHPLLNDYLERCQPLSRYRRQDARKSPDFSKWLFPRLNYLSSFLLQTPVSHDTRATKTVRVWIWSPGLAVCDWALCSV